ncbi:hypothetical protein HD597_008209 [Nonomuraea thailandensis]|uniref:Uncharacterized protein n=1 Tax=Nonomuraea thailandensis TaxID=1188745 RepID=A0A9X2GPV8_9ACTN|nr:hypothetical protein [Nonomuraea thailandensis]
MPPPPPSSCTVALPRWAGAVQALRRTASSHLAVTVIGLSALMTALLLFTALCRTRRKRHATTHPHSRVRGQHRKQRGRRSRNQKHHPPTSPRLR